MATLGGQLGSALGMAQARAGLGGSIDAGKELQRFFDPAGVARQEKLDLSMGAAEKQAAEAAGQSSALRGFQMDIIKDLMSQDPTKSLGFQRALQQAQGGIGRSLGASGLGDSPFAAALQGQAAGNLAANFEQQRMGQLFQALGLNPGLAASPEMAQRIIEMLSNQPDLLAAILPLLGAGGGAVIGGLAGGPAGALAGAQVGGTVFGGGG